MKKYVKYGVDSRFKDFEKPAYVSLDYKKLFTR